MSSPNRDRPQAQPPKSQIGRRSVPLPIATAIKPKRRWRRSGLSPSASGRFSGRCQKLDLREKKTDGYRQRDEAKRADFKAQVGDPRAPHLVDVDEAGMDERDNDGYGYAPAGERVHDLKSGQRQGRINRMAGYRGTQLMAPVTIKGA